jgi:hypothetical protein
VYAPALLALAVSASAADRKVEEAAAKAEAQLAKGLTDEAEKTAEKLVKQQPTAEAWAARARIQLRAGNVEGGALSAAEGAKLGASAGAEMKADALSTLALLDLERGSGQDALAHAREAVAAAATPITLGTLARAQARLGDPAAVETAGRAVAAGASDLGVRRVAADALGALGPAAGREACVQLRAIGFGPNPYGGGMTATPQEMRDELAYADIQKAARAALPRIGCP